MPLPGARIDGDTYEIKVEFESVLNLPLRTRVELNGATVGMVNSVDVRAVPNAHIPNAEPDHQAYYRATAILNIKNNVELPVETTVDVRQHTVFGDTFIGLTIPTKSSGRLLHDGDTIPLAQSKPADAVEDYVMTVVGWVNGGSIPFIQSFLTNVNSAVPADAGEFKKFIVNGTVALHRVAESNDKLSHILNRAEALIADAGRADDVWQLLFQRAPVLLKVVQSVFPSVMYLVEGIRDIAKWGTQAGPSRNAVITTFLGVWTPVIQSIMLAPDEIPRTMSAVAAVLQNKIVPFLSGQGRPNVIITDIRPETPKSALTGDPKRDAKIVAANDQAFRNRLLPVLKMLGFVR
ncbi:Mce family protein [Gordonia effusa NBRC 100432]|uniref:Mce family protein n=1 Tax=Gordonia effusa NBRC 100432 TaxID=1077974 RepID=H0R4X3_9ACTN|nr:Mce family protein [Gordonia effusa NBRC 100432]